MKKLLTLFAILVALGAAAYFLKPSGNEEKTSLSGADRNFAFPQEQMGKVIIQKSESEAQTFTRRDGGVWYLNDKYKVSQFTIPQIIGTLSKITIQNIPSKATTKTILKNIDRVGIQIKIFDLEGVEVRSYRIGTQSHDETGTAFLMDGSSQPYNMYLKGLDGDVRSRFVQSIDKWRDREMFQYKPDQIEVIGVKYHKDQGSSFKLTMDGNDAKVVPLSQFIEPSTKPINPNKVKAYLGEFTRIYAEDFDNDNARRDSIINLVPWATIAIQDKNGDVNEIDFFPFRDMLVRNANTKDVDEVSKIERFFINKKTKDRHDFMVCQNKLIKRLFRGYDYFLD